MRARHSLKSEIGGRCEEEPRARFCEIVAAPASLKPDYMEAIFVSSRQEMRREKKCWTNKKQNGFNAGVVPYYVPHLKTVASNGNPMLQIMHARAFNQKDKASK